MAPEPPKLHDRFGQLRIKQMLVDWKACGLDEKYVCSAHIFQQLEVNLAISESLQLAFPQLYSYKPCNLFCQWPVRHSREKLEAFVFT